MLKRREGAVAPPPARRFHGSSPLGLRGKEDKPVQLLKQGAGEAEGED